MIEFYFENIEDFILPEHLPDWITDTAISENKETGEITVIFCDDQYLLEINKKYLNHDYYTDVITFDYSEGNLISGDIFISKDRVKENASFYNVSFENELKRVIIHGVLHLLGYKDKEESQQKIMRQKENEYLEKYKKIFKE